MALFCCTWNVEVRVVEEIVRVDTVAVPDTVRDSLYFLTAMDSLIDKNAIRKAVTKGLLYNLRSELDTYFSKHETERPDDTRYDYGAYAYDRDQWDGDFESWIEYKFRVLMIRSGQFVNIHMRWEWDGKYARWDLVEISHER